MTRKQELQKTITERVSAGAMNSAMYHIREFAKCRSCVHDNTNGCIGCLGPNAVQTNYKKK